MCGREGNMFFIYNLGEKEIVPSAGWGRGGEGEGLMVVGENKTVPWA